MKRLLVPFLLMFLVACGSTKSVLPGAEPLSATATPPIPTVSATITPTSLPTPQATLSIAPLDSFGGNEISLAGVTSFDQLPGNRATGQPAADFTARLLGGGTFVLSKELGKYLLVLPTSFGCGECTYSLYLLSEEAKPENPDSMNILVLDIYIPDLPEYWQSYAEAVKQSNYRWAVLDTPTFLEDYDVYGLGTFLMINPEGKLVFHSDVPPPPEVIRHLFTLASNEEQK
jgi:hypothetical protein